MKPLILFINIVLAGLLVWSAAGYFTSPPKLATTTSRDKKHTQRTAVKKQDAPAPEKSAEQAVKTIVDCNIFNITRCPEAVGGRFGGTSMTLLGVYNIGNQKGAIIQQATQNRNVFRPGSNGNRRNATQRQIKPKQTFLQGDLMDNGYTVSEIYDDRVVLTRNGGRLELKLELASRPVTQAKNAAARRASMPSQQQMQQRMQMDNMMLMRQLIQNTNQMQRQINNNNSSGNRSNTRSTRSR